MGISEIKVKNDKDMLINVSIPGYHFIFQFSFSNAGGVGFYVKII